MKRLVELINATQVNCATQRYKIIYNGNNIFDVIDLLTIGKVVHTFHIDDLPVNTTDVSWIAELFEEEYKHYNGEIFKYLH